MNQDLKIFVVILSWNGKEDTLACLASLARQSYKNFETIVVDNGSHDGSCEAIASAYKDVIILKQHDNKGFAGGCNVGIEQGLARGADAICLLNNDTKVHEDFLLKLSARMHKEKGDCILGARLCLMSAPYKLDHLGGVWNSKKANVDLIGHQRDTKDFVWDEDKALDYVAGAAMLIHKKTFAKVGLLEEDFFLYFEENDFCTRAKAQNIPSKVCMDAIVWHKVSASSPGKPYQNYYFYRNRLLWMQRNLPLPVRAYTYLFRIIPELLNIKKHLWLKKGQLLLAKHLLGRTPCPKKEAKVIALSAKWKGSCDFFMRRFGQGPSSFSG